MLTENNYISKHNYFVNRLIKKIRNNNSKNEIIKRRLICDIIINKNDMKNYIEKNNLL